jgi:hypothetical protein
MILSKSWPVILIAASLLSAGSVFTNGEVGDFSRSLGVFCILSVKGLSVHKFLPRFLSQVGRCCPVFADLLLYLRNGLFSVYCEY